MSVVIGVDPGSHSAGIAVVEGEELKFSMTVDSLEDANWNDEELGSFMVEFMLSVQEAIDTYEPELLVVELCSVPANMHTNKLLAYWEASAIIAAAMSGIKIKRMRTKEARKAGLGKGNLKKHEAIMKIRHEYSMELSDDEAEAIVFALAGVDYLETIYKTT